MEKLNVEAAVASLLRGATGGGAISVHVAGDLHLYQVGVRPAAASGEYDALLAALVALVRAAKEKRT
jgi:DNA-binding protein YbaB